MTCVVKYALIADGSSDRALLPILRWTLRRMLPRAALSLVAFQPRAAKPIGDTTEQVRAGYGPHLIFVHRDAEKTPLSTRRLEVPDSQGVVAVIPVRMTEAWLLIDEKAIRRAASNPNGTMALSLPSPSRLESLPDPKQTLKNLLVQASGRKGRRLEHFSRAQAVQRVADHIGDFSPLDQLGAFRAFLDELKEAVQGPALAGLNPPHPPTSRPRQVST
jgi:hypothetical protein